MDSFGNPSPDVSRRSEDCEGGPAPLRVLRFFAKPFLPIVALSCAFAAEPSASPAPEIVYIGNEKPNTNADGGLRPAIGVQNIQVYRANRTHTEHADGLSDTYCHAPMLVWWQGKFYLDFLTAPVNEHDAPTQTSYTTSPDGVHWSPAKILFPAFRLPNGELTVMHQRMSWYVAPNGRLLATGFHGKRPEPNDGSGIGRVVREVKADGTLGPIYFIRYSRQNGHDESNTPYPLYSKSPDTEFVSACEALLANKLVTAQWWEEDRSEDGFYKLSGKAISIYHRPDGNAVAVAKDAQHSISADEGASWTRLGFMGNIPPNGSKYWIQRTADGRSALVYNPTPRWRYPLALITSDDGQHFDEMLTVHGELPDQRFAGKYKNMGPQYVRGICEWNGAAPDKNLWLTYSLNKEDIWISRVPVPVVASVKGDVRNDFSDTAVGSMPNNWNIYRPLWTSIQIADAGSAQGHALELRDEDPDDYASATRVFEAQRAVKIAFKLLARQTSGRCEIDIAGPHGERPIQLALEDGKIQAKHEGIWMPAGTYQPDQWLAFSLDVNAKKGTDRFELMINGKPALERTAYFSEPSATMQRLVFRTGEYRARGIGGLAHPEADVKAPASAFLIDDVEITAQP